MSYKPGDGIAAAEAAMIDAQPDVLSELRIQIEVLEDCLEDYEALGDALLGEFNGYVTPPIAKGPSLHHPYGAWAIKLIRERDAKVASLEGRLMEVPRKIQEETAWLHQELDATREEASRLAERIRHLEDDCMDPDDGDDADDSPPVDEVFRSASESIGHHIEPSGRERAIVAGIIQVLSR